MNRNENNKEIEIRSHKYEQYNEREPESLSITLERVGREAAWLNVSTSHQTASSSKRDIPTRMSVRTSVRTSVCCFEK